MRLLPREAFAEVFEPLRGKRVGFVRPLGNVGDRLIEAATTQLFDAFGVFWKETSLEDLQELKELDELVYGGGGNMGTVYPANWEQRSLCLQTGLPVTILPQSFLTPEPRPFHRVFVRERASWALRPDAILAPDLALGLEAASPPPSTHPLGLYLRRDRERRMPRRWFIRDPARLCPTPRHYLELAARYATIITDRLHFAICGLLCERTTILLPNGYHKNRSMFQTWLQALGCHFAETVPQAVDLARASRDQLPRAA